MNAFHLPKWFITKNALLALRVVTISTILIPPFPQLASAQVTPDSSLGTNPSVVVPESATRDRIEGGVVNNTNLFHSFRDFTIETGQEVYFANPAGIETILTRVTGNGSSNILGTLGVLGEADFFLINPNGILFGPDSQLDIGGSFLATTADGIQFEDQGLFSASNPQVPALLTVAPSALFFNNTAPGPIINQSVAPAGINASGEPTFGLRVPDGESLLLAGGEVLIDGGWLNALGGHIDLLGIAGPGQVEIIRDGNSLSNNIPDSGVPDAPLSLNASPDLNRNNVIVQNEAILDVTAGDRGSITITGQNIGILGGSELYAGIAPGLGTVDSQGGDIILRATDDLTIEGPFVTIYNVVATGATGNGGNTIIEANNFTAQNIAFIIIDTFGAGNAGETFVEVQNKVTLTESSTIFNNVSSLDDVDAGGITIQAGSLALLDGAELISSVRGGAVGQAEGIQLKVRDDIVIDGVDVDGYSSGLFATTRPGAVGFSGDVFVSANSLAITRGGRIQTGTRGLGNAGNVTIEIEEAFFLDGSDSSGAVTGIFTDLDTDGIGEGGDIQVTAGTLTLKNGGQFTANTFSIGDAGDITVNVQGAVSIDGANVDGLTTGSTPDALVSATSGFFSSVGERLDKDQTVPAFGNGGTIMLTANSLSLTNGGKLATSVITDSIGNAAPIIVTVQEDIIVDGVNPVVEESGILADIQPGARGNASDIQISAETLRVSQGGALNASIANDGIAGEILLNTNNLEILEGGQITVTTSGAGNAGDIRVLDTNSIILAGENSGLFANTTVVSTGNSGSIFVDSNTVTIQDGAKIALDSQGTGRGGDIELNADFLTLKNNALISTETASNQGGIITLVIDDVVLLRNGSNLSATAGLAEAEGDGGNVNITTDFLVAVPDEDSNITANAFLGQGGNVQITASGIYGIEFQTDEIPVRNDITASSAFGAAGEVDIDTLALDPTRDTTDLPNETGVPRISQRCNPSQGISSFVATGRGGIPLGPEDAISSQDLWEDLYTPSTETTTAVEPVTQPITPEPALTEANDWARNVNGHIELFAIAERLAESIPTPAICSHQG